MRAWGMHNLWTLDRCLHCSALLVRVHYTDNASSYSFAYPVEGAEHVARLAATKPYAMQALGDPNLAFAVFG